MEAARPATEADIPKVADLARDAIAELEVLRGGAVWRAREARQEPVEAGFAALLADDDARVLVGTIDDVPVAYAAARVEHLRDGTTLGVVDDIYVDPGAREVSLGEAMMADLVSWCTAKGCVGMDALALPGQRATKNFFERSGFTARKLVMHHSLRDDEAEAGPEP